MNNDKLFFFPCKCLLEVGMGVGKLNRSLKADNDSAWVISQHKQYCNISLNCHLECVIKYPKPLYWVNKIKNINMCFNQVKWEFPWLLISFSHPFKNFHVQILFPEPPLLLSYPSLIFQRAIFSTLLFFFFFLQITQIIVSLNKKAWETIHCLIVKFTITSLANTFITCYHRNRGVYMASCNPHSRDWVPNSERQNTRWKW